jgi:hypothetical protein
MNKIGSVADKLYEVIEAYRAQVENMRKYILMTYTLPEDVEETIYDGDQRIKKAERAIKEAIK